MADQPRVIAIVPARGGSVGVPRKNVRLLRGRPLLSYVIEALARSRYRIDVWVSTDDEEIVHTARQLKANVVRRPKALATDATTLDPVVHHAVTTVERHSGPFDVVLTVQPTSPLLLPETLDRAIETLLAGEADTVLTVKEDQHLTWDGPVDAPTPLFAARINRQGLAPKFRETGAVVAARRACVTPASRFGPRVRLLPVSDREAIDIDSYEDWWLADRHLAARRIAVRVDGGRKLGLGHIYRALALRSRIFNHDIRFFMSRDSTEGIALAEAHRVPVTLVSGNPEFFAALREFDPEIVLLDVLDTTAEFVQPLVDAGRFVVTFEDLGSGADVAHLTFNELFDDPKADNQRRFAGWRYASLREEFYSVAQRPLRSTVHRILVTFGGADPSNLTCKALSALDHVPGDFVVDVVLGLSYSHLDELTALIPSLRRKPVIHTAVKAMSALMADADLGLTSAGRTVFELIACRTPALVLAQNTRELGHSGIRREFGVRLLGLGATLPDETLRDAIEELLPYEERQQLHRAMLELDLLEGPQRVLGAIFNEYAAFEHHRDTLSRERMLDDESVAPTAPIVLEG